MYSISNDNNFYALNFTTDAYKDCGTKVVFTKFNLLNDISCVIRISHTVVLKTITMNQYQSPDFIQKAALLNVQ
jgi:hypothetical protein